MHKPPSHHHALPLCRLLWRNLFTLLAGRSTEAVSAAAAAKAALASRHEALLSSVALQIHSESVASLCNGLLQVCTHPNILT